MPSANALSAERVEDTSDDESSSSEVNAAPKKQINSVENGVKSKNSASDSLLRKEPNGGSDSPSDESDASRSSSKSSSSSASAGSKRKATSISKQISQTSSKKQKTDLAKVKRVESTPYVPPQGYKASKGQSSTASSQAQNFFKEFEGKQVWHISAPSSFPISKLESISVEAALKGDFALEHKGVNYTINVEDSDGTALLTPKPNGDYAYVAPVTRVFKITEKASQIPSTGSATTRGTATAQTTTDENKATDSSGPTNFFATHIGMKKEPRKQPENLRARYVPFGVVSNPPNAHDTAVPDPDVAMTDAPAEIDKASEAPLQATPKTLKKAKTTKEASPMVEVEATPVKRKKEKKEASSQGESVVVESSQKKKKKEKSQK